MRSGEFVHPGGTHRLSPTELRMFETYARERQKRRALAVKQTCGAPAGRRVRPGRATRLSTNTRTRGSRRSTSSSTSGDPPGLDDNPEPGPSPGPLLLLVDDHWGRINLPMLRTLRAGAQ